MLAAIALFAASTVSTHAQDATWSSVPGQLASGVYNINTNWTPATVPTGTAFFGASNSTTLKFLPPGATVGGWTFDTGASAYTFIASVPLLFNGAGIIINGGSATINNSSILSFFGTSTAGSATINNSSILRFFGTSTAGSAIIINNSDMNFNNTSTAGTATITNNAALGFFNRSTAGSATITNSNAGSLFFQGNSTAGSATITNNHSLIFTEDSGAGSARITNNDFLFVGDRTTAGSATITNNNFVEFVDTSTGGNAAITNSIGAVTDFSASRGPAGDRKLSVGSIAGAGSFLLGRNELTVGGNNLSTEVSGAISGFGGSLVKVGTGTLTLSGNNTYTGGTTIAVGTLRAGATNTFSPFSAVTVASGGTLDLNGFNQIVPGVTNAGLVNMGTGTAPGTILATANYTGTGGTIAMNTFLGGDGSPSDRLIIIGGTRDRQFAVAHHQCCGRPRRRDGGEWHPGGAGDRHRHDGAQCLHARRSRATRRRLRLSSLPWGPRPQQQCPTTGSCARVRCRTE